MNVAMTILLILTVANPAYGSEVHILAVDLHSSDDNRWSVDVTLKHDDTDWDHYADNWRIVDGKKTYVND